MCYSGNSKIKRQIRCLSLDSEIVMVQNTKQHAVVWNPEKYPASLSTATETNHGLSTDLSCVFKAWRKPGGTGNTSNAALGVGVLMMFAFFFTVLQTCIWVTCQLRDALRVWGLRQTFSACVYGFILGCCLQDKQSSLRLHRHSSEPLET